MIDNPMPAPHGIAASVQQTPESIVLRLEWKNHRVRWDHFLVLIYFPFWLMFAAAAVWLTYNLFFSEIEKGNGDLPEWAEWICFGLWLCVAWAIAFGLPITLAGLARSEWIEISDKTISFGQKGILAPNPKTIALESVRELLADHCGDPGDKESFLTLNIFSSHGRDRLGDWLAPSLKIEVFEFLEKFVRIHKIPLQMRLGNDELRLWGGRPRSSS